jgi:homoserine O-succinyltransferase/O-acetyltransferase
VIDSKKYLRVAILDMYNGVPNEGMRCIENSITNFGIQNDIVTRYAIYDIRGKSITPNVDDYDIFISTGGPGSPIKEGHKWENEYFRFMNNLMEYNSKREEKKYVFAICHSFQLLVQFFCMGKVTKRKSTAFGVMPVDLTPEGKAEPLFQGLDDQFWVVDSRDYQVVQPDYENLEEYEGAILCLEKERPHVDLERAVMALRFNEFVIGTQFHPEADGEGMHRLFLLEDKKKAVIENYGEEKYMQMLDFLDDPEKIEKTESAILPNFYKFALDEKYRILEELYASGYYDDEDDND